MAKDLVAKQKIISELRQVNLSQEKILEERESNIWQRGLHLNRQYQDGLNQFAAEPQPFPSTGDTNKFFQWLEDELKFLPGILSKVGDYGAATSVETLLHLMECEGCDHFKKLGSRSYEFLTHSDIPSPSQNVGVVSKIFFKEYWMKSGREGARKKAVDRLAQVFSILILAFVNLKMIEIPFNAMQLLPHSSILVRQSRQWRLASFKLFTGNQLRKARTLLRTNG